MFTKLFNLLFNRRGKYAVVDIKYRVADAYLNNGGNEAAYEVYRHIMGVGVQESWRVVKPWIRGWEGKGK